MDWLMDWYAEVVLRLPPNSWSNGGPTGHVVITFFSALLSLPVYVTMLLIIDTIRKKRDTYQ